MLGTLTQSQVGGGTVPCYNLYQLGFHRQYLLPPPGYKVFTDKHPIFCVEVGGKPR